MIEIFKPTVGDPLLILRLRERLHGVHERNRTRIELAHKKEWQILLGVLFFSVVFAISAGIYLGQESKTSLVFCIVSLALVIVLSIWKHRQTQSIKKIPAPTSLFGMEKLMQEWLDLFSYDQGMSERNPPLEDVVSYWIQKYAVNVVVETRRDKPVLANIHKATERLYQAYEVNKPFEIFPELGPDEAVVRARESWAQMGKPYVPNPRHIKFGVNS